MKADSPSEFPQGDERDDAMWRLLGRAPMPEPDAWFAARTLARCRQEKHAAVSFTRMWRWVLGTGLGVCCAVSLLVAQVHTEKVNKEKNVQEAFEIMASIGDNTDTDSSASSSSWQDSSH